MPIAVSDMKMTAKCLIMTRVWSVFFSNFWSMTGIQFLNLLTQRSTISPGVTYSTTITAVLTQRCFPVSILTLSYYRWRQCVSGHNGQLCHINLVLTFAYDRWRKCSTISYCCWTNSLWQPGYSCTFLNFNQILTIYKQIFLSSYVQYLNQSNFCM